MRHTQNELFRNLQLIRAETKFPEVVLEVSITGSRERNHRPHSTDLRMSQPPLYAIGSRPETTIRLETSLY